MQATADRLIEVDGLQLNVSIRGQGTPLLLINGLGGLIRAFDPLRMQLQDYCTITFDVPGIGQSQMPDAPLRLPRHADLLARLLDILELPRIDLFGVSWGGALAQEFALRHPTRLRRLILAATSAGPALLIKPGDMLAYFDAGTKAQDSQGLVQGGHRRNSMRALLQVGGVQRMLSQNPRAYYHQLMAVLGWTSLPRLWRLRAPTLIIAGEQDWLTRLYNARILHRAIRRSELAIVPHEGHFFVVTSAAQTAGLIRTFLQKGR